MTCYFASDVHLRMDRPERGKRFSRWVQRMEDGDSLLIVGDLCDFWMAARLREAGLMECAGLRALADLRARGAALAILPGNHDLWLCPFYERALGATILSEPLDMTVHGIRLHLVHGHLLGARRRWKAWMESREFFKAFGQLPSPVAGLLDQLLERRNQSVLEAEERRHLAVFRDYAARRRGLADLVVIGHVHRAMDDCGSNPRMIVLGGWQDRSSFLKIDPAGASFHVVSDEHQENRFPGVVSRDPSPVEPRCPTP